MIARFCSADHDRRVLAMTMCAGLATGPDMVPIQKPASASYPAPSHKHKAPVTDFQLPTNSPPSMAPSAISVRRDSPRHMTVLPGGGSLARARKPPSRAILIR